MNPLQSLIDNAKQAGHSVFSVKIAGRVYVYRSINRKEFRDLRDSLAKKAENIKNTAKIAAEKTKEEVNQAAVDISVANLKEEGEEEMVLLGLISHPTITRSELDNFPAGIIASLSDKILMASGFGEEAEEEAPIAL